MCAVSRCLFSRRCSPVVSPLSGRNAIRAIEENTKSGVYSSGCVMSQAVNQIIKEKTPVKPEEVRKLEAYFKRVLNPNIEIRARPSKDDSAEVYLEDEFLGVVFRDDEDGELSYNFSMAILDFDL